MAFFEEIIAALDIDEKAAAGSFIYLCPAKGAVIEGYKKLAELSSTRISVILKDGSSIVVLGNDLSIKELSHSELNILGKVENISLGAKK